MLYTRLAYLSQLNDLENGEVNLGTECLLVVQLSQTLEERVHTLLRTGGATARPASQLVM